MRIQIQNLSKDFGGVAALDRVSLDIPDGSLFFLLGPSGCGKTTLLRCIGGFETPTSGEIRMDGTSVLGLPPSGRNTAMVFQGYALWPHMTVAENVSFGLEMQHLSREEILRRRDEALAQVQITELAHRKPNELSGGQQQRVALARTLAVQPGCLLLDEPLANLDAKLRRDMRREIRRICKENHLTAIYVTHDRQEALSMADGVAILDKGRILQTGSAHELYRRPNCAFIASFLGETNFLQGRVGADGWIDTAAGRFHTAQEHRFSQGTPVTLSLRPEALYLGAEADENAFSVSLQESVYQGEVAQHAAITEQGGVSVRFLELNPRSAERTGERAFLAIAPQDVVVLPYAADPV